MKNHKLSSFDLESESAKKYVNELDVEIENIEKYFADGKALCLINGHFYCAVDYTIDRITTTEPESFNGFNDVITYKDIITEELDVDNSTFRHLKGHSFNLHPDLICMAIEKEIISYLENEKSEQC